ncbi:helix-turn-helix domain-containing protein [Paraglaciecola aquimarina]|uniref:Helix-turn-helix domain-containing protein n=1 Tax=Paraglaciecola aquimarina TaxID=1235557 RepID=A0ABU3T0Q9_9ALTE|nr:helix-turn-helix domain-containing protein [Paraglaciecola aquimarina]MDU0355802.1 helix-turn-helix domain-containing protein [Paraglaciecola aquimarina]
MNDKTLADNLLTPLQVAEILGVSSGTLAVWRSNGACQIPYIKVGRCVRYKRSVIESFLQQQEHLHTHLKTGGK